MFSYIWYILRLTFQIGGPLTVGASMQMEGYTDDEISDVEDDIARDLVIRWVKLLQEAPPSHLNSEGLELLRIELKGTIVPTKQQVHHLKTLFGKHNASRWLNSKLEDILWHMDRYGVEPEFVLQDE